MNRPDLRRSATARAAVQVVIVVALLVVIWQVYGLRDKAEDEESTNAAIGAMLARTCGVASFAELQRQGLVEECRLAQAGELDEALTEGDLPEPDAEPSDVEPDVIDDDPDTDIDPAPLPQGPTSDQVEASLDDYFAENPLAASAAYQSAMRTAVAAYLSANPPADGRPPTETEIRNAVRGYLLANPPLDGEDGADGVDGEAGRGVTAVSLGPEGCFVTFSYSDGSSSAPLGPICGAKGEQGEVGPVGPAGPPGPPGQDATFTQQALSCPDGQYMTGVSRTTDGTLSISCATPPLLPGNGDPGGGG